MTITILLPLLVCLIGAIVYFVKAKEVAQLALYAYFAGLLVTLFEVATHVVKL